VVLDIEAAKRRTYELYLAMVPSNSMPSPVRSRWCNDARRRASRLRWHRVRT